MAVEGPLLASVIARLAEPRYNLAAFGVAFAVAVIVEAPVIMMLGASTALVDGRETFLRLRQFTHWLNLGTTAAMLLVVLTPLYRPIFEGLIGLDPHVADLTRGALMILLPWPAAIGYRRFHQGLLIRRGSPRRVAYGTVVRLLTMLSAVVAFYNLTSIAGAYLGAAALTIAVCTEAVVARWMARHEVRRLTAHDAEAGSATSYGKIWQFYLPLAWTSVVAMAAQPLVTFFMGRAPRPLDSLAVLPVINALTFLFRSLGLAYQEVIITMLARDPSYRRPVLRFALTLGLSASIGLALIVATPFSRVWFQTLSGLDESLYRFALLPAWILIPIPALSVLLSVQRAFLMHQRYTRPITWATVIEIAGIAGLLALLIRTTPWVGAVAAAIAFVGGRLAGNLTLVGPLRAVRGRSQSSG